MVAFVVEATVATREVKMTATLQAVRTGARVSNSLSAALRCECACFSVSPLEVILRTIGVTPISQALVDDYMEQELRNAPPSTMLGRFLYRHGFSELPFDDFLKACLGFLCVVGVLTFGIGSISSWWPAAGAGAVLAIITAILWMQMEDGGFLINIARGPTYWQTTSAEYMYLELLPTFVSERMKLVQQHIPEVRFKVADLRQNRYSLDPVLFAILGEEELAIAIWGKDGKEVCL